MPTSAREFGGCLFPHVGKHFLTFRFGAGGTALGELGDEFLGIPYGAAARFEAAVVRTELLGDDPFDASSFGSACMQTLTATTTYGVEHGPKPRRVQKLIDLERTRVSLSLSLTRGSFS